MQHLDLAPVYCTCLVYMNNLRSYPYPRLMLYTIQKFHKRKFCDFVQNQKITFCEVNILQIEPNHENHPNPNPNPKAHQIWYYTIAIAKLRQSYSVHACTRTCRHHQCLPSGNLRFHI